MRDLTLTLTASPRRVRPARSPKSKKHSERRACQSVADHTVKNIPFAPCQPYRGEAKVQQQRAFVLGSYDGKLRNLGRDSRASYGTPGWVALI